MVIAWLVSEVWVVLVFRLVVFWIGASGLFVVIYDGLFIWLSGLGGFVVGSVWVYCAVWFD